MSDVTWVPVIDSRGFDRDQDGNLYAYCRAVPVAEATPAPTWSQEPPDAEGWWWMWRWPAAQPSLVRIFAGYGEHLFVEFRTGRTMYLDSRLSDAYWLPATVPQPPREVVRTDKEAAE